MTAKRLSVMSLRVHMLNAQLGSIMLKGIKASIGSLLLYYFAHPNEEEFNDLRFTDYFASFKRKRVLSYA